MMDAVPLSVALVAGTLAAFNPCGFPVLSAFLAYNLGSDSTQRPRLPDRIAHGLITGLLVASGFLGTFTVFGLPLSYGLAEISDAVPWIGLSFGAVLLVIGLVVLAGRHLALPRIAVPIHGHRRGTTQILFGVGYGVASLACTLPVFLSLVGAASTSGRVTTTLAVFAAYGVGLAIVLMVLALGATLVRGGLTRWGNRVTPHVRWLTGALLAIAGGYLVYYWLQAGFGSPSAVASDPLVAAVTDFSAWIEKRAESGSDVALVSALAALLAAAAIASLWLREGKGEPVTANQRPAERQQNQDDDRRSALPRVRTVAGALALVAVGGLVGYEIGAGDSGASDAAPPSDAADLSSTGLDARAATDSERESLRDDGRASGISDLRSVDQLRTMFDGHAGTTRIVAILSPTCVTCLRGANWLQQQLTEHPDADIQVYAVWLPLLPSDERTEWDQRILTDSRVIHMWDEQQVTGRWYAEHGYGDLPVQWDALFLYEPDSRWGGREKPSNLLIWRRPVIAYDDELEAALEPLLSG